MPVRLLRTTLAAAFPALALGAGGTQAAERAQTAPAEPVATGSAPFTFKIVGFNDYHGHLESPGSFGRNGLVPAAGRPVVGGAEFLAAYIARIRAANPYTVVVGAGDFVGASPPISALFFDEPAVETLNRIGVAYTSVGNHEFDKGKDELLRLQNGGCKLSHGAPDPNSCRGYGSTAPGRFDGARFKWLSANVVDTASGRTLLPAYGLETLGGVRVAFIGMTLRGTPGIVAPRGVAGLRFDDEAATVNALVPELRALGAHVLVVLVHQGGVQNALAGVGGQPIASDIDGCTGDLKNPDGSDSDLRAIVRQLDDAVDLVVSGHTHAAYNCSANTVDVRGTGLADAVTVARPTGIPNRIGREIPVTSASYYGRVLTEIDVTIDPATRHVASIAPKNVLVDRADPAIVAAIAADPSVKNIVAAYRTAVAPLAGAVLGTLAAAASNAPNAAGEMEAGDLVADAQLAATQPAGLGGAAIAFTNPGGVRAPGFVNLAGGYPYELSYGDAYTVQPFGNSLVTMTLTSQQIKNALEQQFPGCLGQSAQRLLQVSNGLKYTWRAANPPCSKVVDLSYTPTDVTVLPPKVTGPTEKLAIDGVVQHPDRTWRVTVNQYLASGGDGFTSFLGGADPQGGVQDIDALSAYLAGFKGPAAAYDPASATLGKPRIVKP